MEIHSAIFAFVHHLAAFGLTAVLVGEALLLNSEITLANAKRLQRLDMLLGISAGLLLVVGLLRVFLFEKGSEYYMTNAFFLAKFTLFILLGALSVIPTIEFLRWRKATNKGSPPAVDPAKLRRMRLIVHAELAGIVLILLCAALMARGVGSF